MKAVSLTGSETCKLIDAPVPESDGNRVVIRVSLCGICGSDLHFWHNGVGMDMKPGLIMGHEFSGTVHDPGSRGDLTPGDRVTVIPINPCGTCDFCVSGHPNICRDGSKRPLPGLNSPGGYAEYVGFRPDMVRALPDVVSDEEAAMIEPSAVALHAVRRSGIEPGDTVLVSGGGPVGLMAALWARQLGASRVILTEVNAFRMDFARTRLGMDLVFDAQEKGLSRSLKKQFGAVDRVIECSAKDAGIDLGIQALRPRGTLVLTGISYAPQRLATLLLTVKEIEIKTAFGYTPDEFDMTLDQVARQSLDISPLATQIIEPGQVQDAMLGLASGSSNNIKVLIRFYESSRVPFKTA